MIGALAFLTIVGRGRPPEPRQQYWFPVVGAVIGSAVGLVWWGATQWWSPPIAAALAVAADLVVTGLLHVDGLADSADGLLPHMDRQRRLDVMSAPDIGAFALAVVAVALLLRFAGLAGLGLDGARTVAAAAAMWSLSRGVMVVAMNTMAYARGEGGLAQAIRGSTAPGRTAVLGVLTLCLAVTGAGLARGAIAGSVAVVVAIAAGIGVLALAQRRLGGYTGDVLGATGIVVELVGLLALAARP